MTREDIAQRIVWEAAYLRVLGATPVTFRHASLREYAADLQRQRMTVQRSLTPGDIALLRLRTRGIVREHGFEALVADFVPAFISLRVAPNSVIRECKDEIHRCRRKLRHSNFLSASLHASAIDEDGGLQVYPCSDCEGLHVGHTREHFALKRITARIEESRQRLCALDQQRARLQQRLDDLRAVQTKLLQTKIEHEAKIVDDPQEPISVEQASRQCPTARRAFRVPELLREILSVFAGRPRNQRTLKEAA